MLNKNKQLNVFWGSSYDRGLQHLLKIWPEVIQVFPKATLQICYGWTLFDKAYHDNAERQAWKDKINDMMNQPGITHHGRVGKKELKEIRSQCGIWAYPTHFCVTGDTPVDMPRDYLKYPRGVPIEELIGKKDVLVWTFNETDGTFELKRMLWTKKTRANANIIRINWDDGTSIRLTPDHKVLTYKRGWVEAKDLKEGESVVALKKHVKFQVSVGKGAWPDEHVIVAQKVLGDIPKGYHIDHIDGNAFNNSPDNLQILSPEEHAKKTFTGLKRTKQATERAAKKWKEWSKTDRGKKKLSELGSKRAKKFWDLMTPEERDTFVKDRSRKRKEGFEKWWSSVDAEVKSKWGDRGRETRWNHRVLSIEDAGTEDVYDMEVEDNHNFIAGGVVVHNCEIHCISALESQLDGCVPCVIEKAALKETVQSGVKVQGDIYDPKVREKYKEELIALMKDQKRWEEEQKKGIEFAKKFDWSKVSGMWAKYF